MLLKTYKISATNIKYMYNRDQSRIQMFDKDYVVLLCYKAIIAYGHKF